MVLTKETHSVIKKKETQRGENMVYHINFLHTGHIHCLCQKKNMSETFNLYINFNKGYQDTSLPSRIMFLCILIITVMDLGSGIGAVICLCSTWCPLSIPVEEVPGRAVG